MAKKTYETFSGEACERLRQLVKHKNKAVRGKEKMEAARDQAEEDYNSTADSETKKRLELDAAYGHAVKAIKKANKIIRWAENEIMDTVEHGDEAELPFPVNVKVPDFDSGDDDEELGGEELGGEKQLALANGAA